MNDQRPTFCPCSADSSRKAGPSPRSFRNAETGVSVSSMTVCVSGISRWPSSLRARMRTSSSVGVMTPVSAARSSATPGKQHLFGVAQAEPAGGEQDREVVQDVGRLLGEPLVALLARRTRGLLALLLHLPGDALDVGQQLVGVG